MNYKVMSSAAAFLLLGACATPTDKQTVAVSEVRTSTVTPGSSADFIANAGDRVFFEYNKHELSSASQHALDHQAAWLMTYPNVKVVIEGHADERGTDKYNLVLAQKRAQVAKDYLVALGVQTDRVEVVSFGKRKPIVEGKTEEAFAQNRVAISVISSGAAE